MEQPILLCVQLLANEQKLGNELTDLVARFDAPDHAIGSVGSVQPEAGL